MSKENKQTEEILNVLIYDVKKGLYEATKEKNQFETANRNIENAFNAYNEKIRQAKHNVK